MPSLRGGAAGQARGAGLQMIEHAKNHQTDDQTIVVGAAAVH